MDNRSPYRVLAENAERVVRSGDDSAPNGDLFPMLVILWIGSVARVAFGVCREETFGVEPTLALLAVLFVPLLMRDTLIASLRGAGRRRVWRRAVARGDRR